MLEYFTIFIFTIIIKSKYLISQQAKSCELNELVTPKGNSHFTS